MDDEVLREDEVPAVLKVSDAIVASLFDNSEIRNFPLGGVRLTTRNEVFDWVERKMRSPTGTASAGLAVFSSDGYDMSDLPTLTQIRAIPREDWEQVAPTAYRARNGREVNWPENAWAYTFSAGLKEVPMVVCVFGPNGPQGAKEPYPHWGAEVYLGRVQRGLRSIVEWIRTDDYDKPGTDNYRRLASIIKNPDGSMVREDQPLPPGYDQMETSLYKSVISREYAKSGKCCLGLEFDWASLVFHALLRCRQKKLI